MPEMDGWEVLAELKRDPDLADIPMVMLTFVPDDDLGYTLGASDYLVKPVDPERLRTILSRYSQEPSSRSVLVVEDNGDDRQLIKRVLEKEGYVVNEAGNGQVGLQRVVENRPDLILLDLMMPVMDGFELLAELSKHEQWRDIPAVVITAKDLDNGERRRLNTHVKKIMSKGTYTQKDLPHEVHRLLEYGAGPHPAAELLSASPANP